MGDLSRNLSKHEFACKCGCGFDSVSPELVRELQALVDAFEKKGYNDVTITINSGNRCPTHNRNEGGSVNSRHMQGLAADFKLKYKTAYGVKKQIDPTEVADYLDRKYPDTYGVGWYNGRTHFDVSHSGKRRWDQR
jgi:uncharacterized protein YcbK (DUF882 family)